MLTSTPVDPLATEINLDIIKTYFCSVFTDIQIYEQFKGMSIISPASPVVSGSIME